VLDRFYLEFTTNYILYTPYPLWKIVDNSTWEREVTGSGS
jgi:hypothetical protein